MQMTEKPGVRKDLSILAKISAELSEAELILASLRKYQDAVDGTVGGSPNFASAIGDDIAELEKGIEKLRADRDAERESLEAYISGVSDSRAQTYMRLHYLRGLSWNEVAKVTDCRSAEVARTIVGNGINAMLLQNREEKHIPNRKELTEFARLSADMAIREHALEILRESIQAIASSHTIQPEDFTMLEAEISRLRTERTKRQPTVEAFIASIDVPLVQTYMRLHYFRGLTWDEVAQLTHATSGNAVRTRVMRYLSLRTKAAQAALAAKSGMGADATPS